MSLKNPTEAVSDDMLTIDGYKPYTKREIQSDINRVSPWFSEDIWFYDVVNNTLLRVVEINTDTYTLTIEKATCEHSIDDITPEENSDTNTPRTLTASELRGELVGGYLRGIPQGGTHEIGDSILVNTGEYVFIYNSTDIITDNVSTDPEPINLRYSSLHPNAFDYDISVDATPVGIYSTSGPVPSGDQLTTHSTNTDLEPDQNKSITATAAFEAADKTTPQPDRFSKQEFNETISIPYSDDKVHKTITGDSTEVLTDIPPETVQLTVTSPPYNIDKEYEGYDDDKKIREWKELMHNVLSEVFRITKPDGKCVVNIGKSYSTSDDDRFRFYPLTAHIKQIALSIGFDFWDEIIWEKSSFASRGGGALMGSYPHPTNFMITQTHEHILVFRKYVNESYFNTRTLPSEEIKQESAITKKRWRNITQSKWEIDGVTQSDTETDHTAVYPEEIPKRAIQLYSFAGDYVLDPFAGTGTTGVAAKKSGRNYIGVEQEESYARTGETNIKQAEYNKQGYIEDRENSSQQNSSDQPELDSFIN